jgi:hypothetical protein
VYCYTCRSFIILERRTAHHDSLTPSANTDPTVTSLAHNMAMSTTSQPSSNPSLFVYRSSLTGGSTTVRQRAIAETTSNNLLITTERFKSNISTSMRPARQPLSVTTPIMPSAYIPSQQPQRNVNQNPKTRVQQDKSTNLKGILIILINEKEPKLYFKPNSYL